jgi:hypothetical protein
MTEKQIAQKLVKAAPSLTAEELDRINGTFRAFIFRRSKTRELWTTCCGRHEVIPKYDYGEGVAEILFAQHHTESEFAPSAWGPGMTRIKRDSELHIIHHCPYCGKGVFVKELGRTGKRDNLAEYKDIAIIRWFRGALWVRAYWTNKKYGDRNLTAKPAYTLGKVYRFKPGEAACAYDSWMSQYSLDNITRITEKPKELPLRIYEPFSDNNRSNGDYILFGCDEVKKSPFKYCKFDEYCNNHNAEMRFLTLCCILPRQVEMLMKTGMSEVITDLIFRKKWNAAAFKWEEEDPLTSFDLDRNEMKAYLETKKNADTLAQYKQFRRKGIKCEVADLDKIYEISTYKAKDIVRDLKNWKVEPARWLAYIDKAHKSVNAKAKSGACGRYGPRMLGKSEIVQYWLDYLHAAEKLGYDLKNPLVQMPRDLYEKHDEATGVVNAMLEAERKKEAARQKRKQRAADKKAAEEVKKRVKKYEFCYGGFITSIPLTYDEVITEGKKLKHCVGGYAERHMRGVLTIVFLRKESAPDKPLVTIEMNGKTMVQLHGYDNDKKAKMLPEEKYKDFLDPWLTWINAGSKRDEDGNPVLPKSRKSKNNELAQAS